MGNCDSCSKAKKSNNPEQELGVFHHFVTEKLIPKHSKHGLKEAFVNLGGGDDEKVEREEMIKKLESLQYPGDSNMLFDLLDTDNEGFITKAEFVNSTKKDYLESGPLRDFSRFVNVTYGSIDEAFSKFDSGTGDSKKGKSNDSALSLEEFTTVLEKMKYKGDASIIYRLLDKNQDATVTVNEFKERLHKKK